MQAQGLESLVRPKKYRFYRGAGHVAIATLLIADLKLKS